MRANLLDKILAPLLLFAFFEASQGMTLLSLPRLVFSEASLKSHAWIQVYEGHIWELIFALVLMGIYSNWKFSEWGINLKNSRLSWSILWKFSVIFLAITLLWDVAPNLKGHGFDLGNFGPMTVVNVVGWLSFEWIFVGISEEVMFRGLIQSRLMKFWPELLQVGKIELPVAGLITAVLFCLAHVNPLHPTFNWQQLLFAFALGIYYSVVRHRTGSLLNPILAHNIGDGMIVSSFYLLAHYLK